MEQRPFDIRSPVSLLTSFMVYRYTVYRRVLDYYSDNPTAAKEAEDAFDMRKPLSRDKHRQHVRKNGRDVKIDPEDIYHG